MQTLALAATVLALAFVGTANAGETKERLTSTEANQDIEYKSLMVTAIHYHKTHCGTQLSTTVNAVFDQLRREVDTSAMEAAMVQVTTEMATEGTFSWCAEMNKTLDHAAFKIYAVIKMNKTLDYAAKTLDYAAIKIQNPLLANNEKSSVELLPAIEAAMDIADAKVRSARDNDLRRQIVDKENKAKLCPMADELSRVTRWSGKVVSVRSDRGSYIMVKLHIGEKFDAEITVQNTAENVEYLTAVRAGTTIQFHAKLMTDDDFCIHFTPTWTGYRENGQFFFINLGGKEDQTYFTAVLLKQNDGATAEWARAAAEWGRAAAEWGRAGVERGRAGAERGRAAELPVPAWKSHIVAQLEKHKRYPEKAQSRRDQGVVQVFFTLDREGQLIKSRVVGSSGVNELDEEALAILQRAAPFPPPPDVLAGDRVDLTVPIRFNLK